MPRLAIGLGHLIADWDAPYFASDHYITSEVRQGLLLLLNLAMQVRLLCFVATKAVWHSRPLTLTGSPSCLACSCALHVFAMIRIRAAVKAAAVHWPVNVSW